MQMLLIACVVYVALCIRTRALVDYCRKRRAWNAAKARRNAGE